MTTDIINGQLVELGQTHPDGLAIGEFSNHRKLIQWNIPGTGIVEMYINPQSLTISEKKIIKDTRTKGGYIVQYWGEALSEIDISGTTGSGGIEGINVLRGIYRQEQVGFSTVIGQLNQGFLNNLFQTAIGAIKNLSADQATNPIASTVIAAVNPDKLFNDISTTIGNVANVFDSVGNAITTDQQLLPTLATLATSVEMLYDGVTYRGFFREFRVDEKAQEVGAFNYSIKFCVTRRSGIRVNSYPWNRSVNFGPANSDIVPLSFGALQTTSASVSQTVQATQEFPAGISRRSSLVGK